MPRDYQKVKVLPRSGFDKSHRNSLTFKCGTLVPAMIDEVIPNTKVHCRVALTASLPPLASDAFMNVQLKAEAFFVPFRLLFGSFESWFADENVPTLTAYNFNTQTITINDEVGSAPKLSLPNNSTLFDPGTLSDYLGMRRSSSWSGQLVSALPYLAYHRVYDDWYRNTKVQKPVFARMTLERGDSVTPGTSSQQIVPAAAAPYYFFNTGSDIINVTTLADGHSIYNLRQRNFGQDIFTNAMPRAQYGSPMEVTVSSNKFSIAQLRSMNSLQQFEERNNIASSRLQDVVLARYGADLSTGVAQRSLFLGSASYTVYSKGVFATASDSAADSNNPFYEAANNHSSPGARFGSAYAEGSDLIISGFTANEPGYIMVMVSLVPQVAYDTGVNDMFLRYCRHGGDIVEMANPMLENVGLEPLYSKQLTGDLTDNTVFGYTDRYSSFKYKLDEIHGTLHDGQPLESFALKRNFYGSSGLTINSNFLQIPTSYLNGVAANVDAHVSDYGCWCDMYFDYKISQPLSEFSMPSLQNPAEEHGVTVTLHRGAFNL